MSADTHEHPERNDDLGEILREVVDLADDLAATVPERTLNEGLARIVTSREFDIERARVEAQLIISQAGKRATAIVTAAEYEAGETLRRVQLLDRAASPYSTAAGAGSVPANTEPANTEPAPTPIASQAESDYSAELASRLCHWLGLDQLDPDVPLYDLGADSLTLLDLMAEVYQRFGVELPLSRFSHQVSLSEVLASLAEQTPPGPEAADVPLPADGRAEARRFLDALQPCGALDEGSAQAVDRLVDSWVPHWLRGARAEWEQACAAAKQRIADADSQANYVRDCLSMARGRLAYAREALLRAGRLPEPNVAQVRWDLEEGDLPQRGAEPGPDSTPLPRSAGEPADQHGGQLAVDELMADGSDQPGRIRTVVTWVLLSVMAGADAFGFWQTLVGIIQKNTALTAFFVAALTIGAVLVAYQIGRMARRISDGYAGNGVPWLVTISSAWLGLGVVEFWIRAHPNVIQVVGSQDGGVFGGASAAGTSAGQSWSQTWGYALLLLMLYFATGILTITDAWSRESPRRRMYESLTLRLRQAQQEVASYRRHMRTAEAAIELAKSASTRISRDHSGEDSCLEEGRGIKEDSRVYLAQLLGNPSNTAAVLNTPVRKTGSIELRDGQADVGA
jgi:acyl carrier protein